MELYDVMRTTFSARAFTDEALSDDVLYRILDNARFAANGGNRQGWKVIVVRSMTTRRSIADLMVEPIKRYEAQVQAGENPWNTIDATALDAEAIERTAPPGFLLDAIMDAPLTLMVCVDLAVVASTDQYVERVGVASGASIYPFVWNILLAARNEGFGGVLTTFAIAEEDRIQSLLGLPKPYAVAAVVPLGKPVKQLTKLRRNPVESFARLERWDGEPFDAILLDAPCSGTGVIRRHPDIKLARRHSDVAELAALQARLLDALWPKLAPGGTLLYATCSVLPVENAAQIEAFLSRTPDAVADMPDDLDWGQAAGHGRQLLPTPAGHDGFFYARLRKRA